MAQTASKFFNVMVVGNNPEELLKKYKIGEKVEPYIKYHYLDAEKIQKNSIKILTELCKNYKTFQLSKFHLNALQEKLKSIKNMSPFEYYQAITYGCTYDENGDAWCDVNPNGKFNSYQKGNHFSNPLILHNGEESYFSVNGKIDWGKMHLANAPLYSRTWDLAVGDCIPENENEVTIKKNTQNNQVYFSKFKDKEEYVRYSSSYWNYAYLDENGWVDADDAKSMNEWITTFYNKFVTQLKPTDIVTIFECSKNDDDELQ